MAVGASACVSEGDDAPLAARQEASSDDPFEVIENQFGMRFIGIPSLESDSLTATAKALFIQDTEVTYEQYRRFLVASGRATDPSDRIPSDVPLSSMDFDDWKAADRFAWQLSDFDPKYRYRLPTEAEWEHACLAGSKTPPQPNLQRRVPGKNRTLVKQGKPNAYGLYDMLGVHGEYCSDRFWSLKYPESMSSSKSNLVRVVRGMRVADRMPGDFKYSFSYRHENSAGHESNMVTGVRLILEKGKR